MKKTEKKPKTFRVRTPDGKGYLGFKYFQLNQELKSLMDTEKKLKTYSYLYELMRLFSTNPQRITQFGASFFQQIVKSIYEKNNTYNTIFMQTDAGKWINQTFDDLKNQLHESQIKRHNAAGECQKKLKIFFDSCVKIEKIVEIFNRIFPSFIDFASTAFFDSLMEKNCIEVNCVKNRIIDVSKSQEKEEEYLNFVSKLESLQKRKFILFPAIQAHKKGDYQLSIPLFFLFLEGVVNEILIIEKWASQVELKILQINDSSKELKSLSSKIGLLRNKNCKNTEYGRFFSKAFKAIDQYEAGYRNPLIHGHVIDNGELEDMSVELFFITYAFAIDLLKRSGKMHEDFYFPLVI